MAFDRSLEADRVDDLNLLSFLVRAPVVGTLMWFLGGDEAKKQHQKEEQEEQLKAIQEIYADSDEQSSSFALSECDRPEFYHSSQHKLSGDVKRGRPSSPRLLGSDISDFGECAVEEEVRAMLEVTSIDKKYDIELKKTKRMSWSDESGQDLVRYVDESIRRDPTEASSLSTTSLSAKPTKSAMKRSSSVRHNVQNNSNDTSRLIPKGLGGGSAGVRMPTKPFGDAKGSSSYTSPEWGWYANITPPTPETYSVRATKSIQSLQKPSRHPAPIWNPAFHKDCGRERKIGLHWPSVPL